MAKFFKSVVFKCTITLLLIACISGGLLALLNDVLYVSPEERTARAMSKIYGQAVTISQENVLLDVDDKNRNDEFIDYSFGQINKIYVVGDKNSDNYDMIFQTVGNEGYKGGTITLWIQVSISNGKLLEGKIEKIVLESYVKQTLMSKFDSYYYDEFVNKYKAGEFFTAQENGNGTPVIMSGATYSANSNCNAVNCVINYLQLEGGND